MLISEVGKRVLREIGLNTYETHVYITLLERGSLTAMEISKKAFVPYSKIYEVLNSLKEKSFIKRTVKSRPSKYYPTPPLESITAAKLRFEDKYECWKQVIVSELQPLYDKQDLVEHPEILIMHGQKGVIAKLEDIFRKATKEIMIAAPGFARKMFTKFSLEALLKARANIKFMVTGKIEDWKDLKILVDIEDLRIRDQMFGGGIIVDGKEAVLFLGEEKSSLVIWSNHVGLVRFAREYFQFLWDSSNKI